MVSEAQIITFVGIVKAVKQPHSNKTRERGEILNVMSIWGGQVLWTPANISSHNSSSS